MKRKTRTENNARKIIDFLSHHPSATAAAVQNKTGIKGNIYTTLARLVKNGELKKIGVGYEVNDKAATKTKVSPWREKKFKVGKRVFTYQKNVDIDTRVDTNPYRSLIATYTKEIAHIQSGIDQLVIAKNYLERRVEEMEDAD